MSYNTLFEEVCELKEVLKTKKTEVTTIEKHLNTKKREFIQSIKDLAEIYLVAFRRYNGDKIYGLFSNLDRARNSILVNKVEAVYFESESSSADIDSADIDSDTFPTEDSFSPNNSANDENLYSFIYIKIVSPPSLCNRILLRIDSDFPIYRNGSYMKDFQFQMRKLPKSAI